ncbi:NlpC/P60 family protein [Paenibacillaceae bacterium]|nr:NlpC/P60 family protein [Paenibacillaceae bacterium]
MDDAIGELIGIKYKYGGTTTSGFDCSGFTSYVFNQFDIELPRTSAGQAKVGKHVDKDALRSGDLVFFNTNGKGVSHVGIYVGDGKFAHASSSKGIMISGLNDSYFEKRYVTARRAMSDVTFEKFADEPSDVVDGGEDL